MDLDDKLSDVFDRGYENEGASLSPEEKPYYLAQDFILKYEFQHPVALPPIKPFPMRHMQHFLSQRIKNMHA
jgi:hypothetical protein